MKAIKVDDLAQEIRRVYGNRSLGAGALAEALMPFLASPPLPQQGGEAIEAEKVRYGMMKTTYIAELEMLRTFNYEQCREAWKDMFHKTRPLVEYNHFENIWRMCLERTATPASLGEAKPDCRQAIDIKEACLLKSAESEKQQGEAKAVAPVAISEFEMKCLKRMHACFQDGEGHDIDKEDVYRLIQIGLVHVPRKAYYEFTDFGQAMLAAPIAPALPVAAETNEPPFCDQCMGFGELRGETCPHCIKRQSPAGSGV